MREFSEIVHVQEPITLVGAGDVADGDISDVRRIAPRVFAADGGGHACLDAGVMPERVIGDMDSGEALVERGVPAERIMKIAEQDSTDFDKALRHISAPLVIGVGFAGARIDHQLACFNTLVRRAAWRCVIVGQEEVVFVAPPRLELPLAAGTRVSLFPMREGRGRSLGLRWPIEGLVFSPDGRVGTSNEATGPVTLEMERAGMLVMLPRDQLDCVAAALLAEESNWQA